MRAEQDDDHVDGCAVDLTVDPTPDEDVAGLVLFADVDPEDPDAIAARKAEWAALWGEG